jgi:hypothetical protein
MQSFKAEIQLQINKMPEGRIFTFSDLSFPTFKIAHVAVIMSRFVKEKKLARIEKGVYYKPKLSDLDLGYCLVYHEEKLNYLTRKVKGYLTGAYIYNKMSLTEQVPSSVVTIAVRYPVRAFKFETLSVKCVKAYVDISDNSLDLYLVRILDAIKDYKHIPGTSPQIAYERIFNLHVSLLDDINLEKLVSLSENYPPRVKKILRRMLHTMKRKNCLKIKIENKQ